MSERKPASGERVKHAKAEMRQMSACEPSLLFADCAMVKLVRSGAAYSRRGTLHFMTLGFAWSFLADSLPPQETRQFLSDLAKDFCF
jgi:hypothetical protein